MSKMKSFFEDVMKMPYYKNYAASSGKVHNVAKHEDAVESLLQDYKIKESRVNKISKGTRDQWLSVKSAPEMENNSYISQPCGTHNSPDFIVKADNKLYFLECKSVKGGSPMYNSGVPKSGYVYILSSETHNKTTFYKGEDVLSSEEERLIQEHIKEARERDAKLNALLNNSHGIKYYTRPMIQHQGSRHTQDYFVNKNRFQLEQNVLEAV